MMYDITKLRSRFEDYIRSQVTESTPTLEIIQVGDDFASNKYIQFKTQKAQDLGIITKLHKFAETTQEDLISLITKASDTGSGLIVQLPLPNDLEEVIKFIPAQSDIDLLANESKDLLHPTIQAIDLALKDILEFETDNFEDFLKSKPDYSQHKIAVIGQGKLVGQPVSQYFEDRGADLRKIDEFTENPKELTQSADIVITAVGKPNLVDKSWLNPKAIIIDAATSESSGQLRGDLNLDNLHDSNIYIAPPKGIGSLTILSLFYNLLTI